MEPRFYKCKICSTPYSTVGTLKRHLKEQHNLSTWEAIIKLDEWGYEEIEGTKLEISIDKSTLKKAKKGIDKLLGVL